MLKETIKKWFRIKIAKLISVLDILEYANEHRDSGLCIAFRGACCNYNVSYDDFLSKCTMFNWNNASFFGVKSAAGYWWPSSDWTGGRKEFLDYLIEYYKKERPIYLKHL